MNYIIWGAGKFENEIIDFLGYLRVECFIDSKLTGDIQGKPIMTYEECKQKYPNGDDYIVVINAETSHSAIANILEKDKIYRYFVFNWDDQFRIFDTTPFSIVNRKRIDYTYAELLGKYNLMDCQRVSV